MSKGSNYGCRSSSSTSSDAHSTFYTINCKCGFRLPVITSWTPDNPGRRYQACPNYGKSTYCGVFKWLDPEICGRSKMIIPGLLRRVNKLEAELACFKEKEEILNQVEGEVACYKEKEEKLNKLEGELAKERRIIQKRAKKLEGLIAMYNKRMKLEVGVFMVILLFIAIYVMKIGIERGYM
ncbi:hypothetical protein ABFS83_14G033100 [Erythranthe nasuta]